jgi:hypothetical protein
VPIGWRVRDVASAEEPVAGEATTHAHKIFGSPREHVPPGQAIASEHNIPPYRIEVRSYQATYSSTTARSEDAQWHHLPHRRR